VSLPSLCAYADLSRLIEAIGLEVAVPKRTTSVRPPPVDSRPKNKLLASLPQTEFDRLRPHLRTLPVRAKQIFHSMDEPIRDVIFPNGGVASLTTVLQDGTMIEIATVGREGLLGIDVVLGGNRSSGEAMLQVPDTDAAFLPIAEFRAEFDRRGPFFECVQRYSQAVLKLMMHSTACIASHAVHERCCRWLLMTHDRVGADRFQLSQEFLAVMLGSTRPTVNLVAGTLQKAGLITYTHAHITIIDRKGLEAASCECYAVVKSHYDRLGV
jgi:CRP-like cAMP-binding protein